MEKIDIGTHINLNEYSDLVEECVGDKAEKGDSQKSEKKGDSHQFHHLAEQNGETGGETGDSHQYFLNISPRGGSMVVTGFLVIELLLLGVLGLLGAANMGSSDAAAAKQELAESFRADADLTVKLDRFLVKTAELGTTRDRRFVQAVEELNRGLRTAEEEKGTDQFGHEDFKVESFTFLGSMLKYVPRDEE